MANAHIHDYQRTTDHMTSDNEFSPNYPMFISSIPSSSLDEKLVWTHIAKPIGYVETLMLLHKYNQLPVFDSDKPWSKHLRGIVTWQSIARARLVQAEPSLAEALEQYPLVVDRDLDLFTAIPRILDAEVVLVRDKGQIVGLITSYDLTEYFAKYSEPFFLSSEIEVLLRALVKKCIDEDELGQYGGSSNPLSTFDELGIGDCKRILEQRECWERLSTNQDRATVVAEIDRARETRNQLMHGHMSEMGDDKIRMLRNFLDYLRILTRPPRNRGVAAKDEEPPN